MVGGVYMAVTKTFSDSTPNEGDTIIWSITARNNGPAQATGVSINDLLPAGLTYVSDNSATLLNSVNAATTYNSGTGVWTIGTLNNAASLTLQITATVDVGTGGTSITNTAAVGTIDQVDRNPSNNDDDAQITIGGLDLAVTKTADGTSYDEGDTVVYSITVENLGAADATNVVVTDDLSTLPLAYVSDNSATLLNSAGVATAYNSGTGDWTIGALNAGDSLTLQVTVTVNAGTSGTSINNIAIVTGVDQTDNNPNNNDDDATITIGGLDISVNKVVDNPAPSQGDDVTYTITVRNLGTGTATGVIINEDLPLDGVNLTYVSDNPSQGTFTPGAPGTWDIGTLNAGQTVTLELTVTVEIADGQIVNIASLIGVDQPDSNPNNNSDEATITLNGIDLEVEKVVDNPSPSTGDQVTYSVTARNNGPGTATGVVVLDILPAGVTYVSDNAPTLQDDTSTPTSYDVPSGDWTIGTLDAGSSLTLQITVTVDVNGGQIINTAEISSDQEDSNPGNDSDDAVINIDSADLSLTKSISTDTPAIGDFITYTIIARNAGPNAAFNVEVTDTMPSTVTYSGDYSASQGTFNGTVWNVGTIPVNGLASLEITVEVTSNVGTFVNIAEVTASDQSDPDSTPNNGDTDEDDYAESTFLFDPPFGRKTVNERGLPELLWGIEWVNPGPTALVVEITDDVPAGTTFIAGSLICDPQGSSTTISCIYDPITNRVSWNGVLAPDTGATRVGEALNSIIITFRTNVQDDIDEVRNRSTLLYNGGAESSDTNRVIWERSGDSDNSDGDDNANNGDAAPDLSGVTISKSVEPPFALPGDTVTWTIPIINNSTETVTNITATDTLDAGLELISSSTTHGSVNVSGSLISISIPELKAGEVAVIKLITRVSDNVTVPFIILNEVQMGDQLAQANLLGVTELPQTGESPWSNWRFMSLSLLVGLVVVAGGWRLRRSLWKI